MSVETLEESKSDLLQQPADPRAVRLLFAEGLIDDRGRRSALEWLLGPLDWWQWIDKTLLFLGLLLMRAGVVCFIAWNWADMPGWLKLGLIQLGIVGASAFALRKGLDSLLGKAATTGACTLVGVFLAVYGQVYQTGADAYSLFVGWAVLTLPWVVLCKFDLLWMLWIALVNVAMTLTCSQLWMDHEVAIYLLAMALSAVNASALVARELAVSRGCQWVKHHWVRWILSMAAIGPLLVSAIAFVWGVLSDRTLKLEVTVGMCLFLAMAISGFVVFKRVVRDLFVLAVIAVSVAIWIDSAVARFLFDTVRPNEALSFLILGLTVLATTGCIAAVLLSIAKKFRAERVHSGAAQLFAPENSDKQTIGLLLDHLQQQAAFTETARPLAVKVLEREHSEHAPWFLQSVVGAGAWVSCLLFLICMSELHVFRNIGSAIGIGAILVAGGLSLDRMATRTFWRQLGLAASFTGFGCALVAVGEHSKFGDGLLIASLVSLPMTAGLYGLYRNSVMRFAMPAITQVLAVSACLSSNSPNALHAIILLQTLGLGFNFALRPQRALWPLGYALMVGLAISMLLPLLDRERLVTWPSSITQSSALLSLIVRLMKNEGRARDSIYYGTLIAVVLLGLLGIPGVLTALLIVMLGHMERDGVLRAFGIGYLPLYLIAFYFNLDTSLLFKSGSLIVAGAILWTARHFVRRHIDELLTRTTPGLPNAVVS